MKQIIKLLTTALILIMFPFSIIALTDNQNEVEQSYNTETENETEYETELPDDTGETLITSKTYIVSKTNGLTVRANSSSSSTALGTLDKGDMVALIEAGEYWYTTKYRGKTAYVSASSTYTYLYQMETGGDAVEATIAAGEKYLGTPYVYGATRLHSGNGTLISGFTDTEFDCSSLMQYMFYYGAGINLQMNTRTQVLQGTYVAKADLQRGDLIFFTNSSRYYNTGIERVGHVAIYLGNNYILHTASDHAVIEQISSTRWSYYIEARRIIN